MSTDLWQYDNHQYPVPFGTLYGAFLRFLGAIVIQSSSSRSFSLCRRLRCSAFPRGFLLSKSQGLSLCTRCTSPRTETFGCLDRSQRTLRAQPWRAQCRHHEKSRRRKFRRQGCSYWQGNCRLHIHSRQDRTRSSLLRLVQVPIFSFYATLPTMLPCLRG